MTATRSGAGSPSHDPLAPPGSARFLASKRYVLVWMVTFFFFSCERTTGHYYSLVEALELHKLPVQEPFRC